MSKTKFYYQDQIDECLICQNCGRLFENPKLLPCGESLCESCTKKIEQSLSIDVTNYICPLCNRQHQYPEDGCFPVNRILVDLLKEKPNEFIQQDFMVSLAHNLDKNVKKVTELESMLSNNGIDRVKDYCQSVKSQISNAMKIKVDSIYKLYELYLEKVNSFEEDTLKYLNENFLDFRFNKEELIKDANEFDSMWRTCLNKHNIDKKDVSYANETALKIQLRVENKIKEVNKMIFNNKTCEFYPNNHILEEDIIGK